MKCYNRSYWFLFLTFACVVSSCSKKEEVFYGEPPVKISSITTSYGQPENIVSYTQSYLYNTDGNLVSINDTRQGEGFQKVIYTQEQKIDSLIYQNLLEDYLRFIHFEYDGDRLIGYHDNHISEQFGTKIYSKEYKYNSNGYVEEEFSTFKSGSTTSNSHVEYTWKNGNISIMKQFGSDGELDLEIDLRYDDKKNFAKNNVSLVNQYQIWSKNNVVRSITTDYTGIYDPSCYDCPTSYTYTSDDYVKTMENDWGTKIEIESE